MDFKDYYATLGVSKSADEKTIRKAYRKLARKYHPDVNADDAVAEGKFKEINEAQEVLLDAEKRKLYDRFGAEWESYQRAGIDPNSAESYARSRPPGSQYQRQPSNGTRTVNPEEFEQVFGDDFGNFYESMFGRAQQARSRPPARGQDIEHVVNVTLEEAFHGTTRSLQYEDGRTIEAKIPRGVRSGSKVRLSGQGGQGSTSGDLYLNVEVMPHIRFERDGDDLKMSAPVDLLTMLLGDKADVATMERNIKLTIPAETANGKTFKLSGLGMPNLRTPDKRGDLYVVVSAELPQNLSERERKLIKQWRDLR